MKIGIIATSHRTRDTKRRQCQSRVHVLGSSFLLTSICLIEVGVGIRWLRVRPFHCVRGLNPHPRQKGERVACQNARKRACERGKEGVALCKREHCPSHQTGSTERQANVDEDVPILEASDLDEEQAIQEEKGADAETDQWDRVRNSTVVCRETWLARFELGHP